MSILVIGYGNASRRDDGVAYHLIERLRQRLGLPSYEESESAPETSQDRLAMVFVHQLATELAETVQAYDVVVFIDAHVHDAGWGPVHWQEIAPAYQPSLVTHHLKPAAILALCQSLYGRAPRGYILSVLGHDFDFGEELAPDTSARCDQALVRLLALLIAEGCVAPSGDGPQLILRNS
ncbi:MAG: hydrogenase maturation protease [Chloroflexota bacterium]